MSNHLKSIQREQKRQKAKFKPKGGTLAGQKRKMETSKFYENLKKKKRH